jgi:hypothetical protein
MKRSKLIRSAAAVHGTADHLASWARITLLSTAFFSFPSIYHPAFLPLVLFPPTISRTSSLNPPGPAEEFSLATLNSLPPLSDTGC